MKRHVLKSTRTVTLILALIVTSVSASQGSLAQERSREARRQSPPKRVERAESRSRSQREARAPAKQERAPARVERAAPARTESRARSSTARQERAAPERSTRSSTARQERAAPERSTRSSTARQERAAPERSTRSTTTRGDSERSERGATSTRTERTDRGSSRAAEPVENRRSERADGGARRDGDRGLTTTERVRARMERTRRTSGDASRRDFRVGRMIEPVRRDKVHVYPSPVVHRRYAYDRRNWDLKWRRRYHPRWRSRGLSINWHFWYGRPVFRYDPYWYYPRRYYRLGRPVVGFYIRVPSYRTWHAGWTTRYIVKQTVHTDAAYDAGRFDSRLEVHTKIRQRVTRIYRDRVHVEFRIEGMSVFDDGYFLGEVTAIPRNLGTMKVTLYNDGYVEYDRMSYLIGDPSTGFELISTRYYGGHLLNEFRRADGMRVGELDFYDRRVRRVGDSMLFDPYDFNGLVPVSLLPDDDYWGFQYLVGGYRTSDDYYYGSADYYDSFEAYDDGRFYSDPSYYAGAGAGSAPSFESVGAEAPFDARTAGRSFSNQGQLEYRLEAGYDVKVDRTVEIEHLGG